MSAIRFYTDEHIDSAVVRGLQRRGVEALTCQEAGLRTKSDAEHFEFFIASGVECPTSDNTAFTWQVGGLCGRRIVTR